MAPPLDWARLFVGTGLLLYAAVSDLRTRRVPNITWIVGTGFALAILVADYAATGRIDWTTLLIIAGMILAAYTFWFLHLIAGGADAKALMVLAVLSPLPPALTLDALEFPVWPSPLPGALVAFLNSLLVFVSVPLLFFAWNAVKADFQFPAMLLGYRMTLDEAEARFVWVMERALPDGRVRLMMLASRFSPEDHAENARRLRELGVKSVWVTPKIPFMLPLLGGFASAYLLGDAFSHFLVEPLVGTR